MECSDIRANQIRTGDNLGAGINNEDDIIYIYIYIQGVS